MTNDDEARRRAERLLALLAPLHDGARRTARRLCRSNADGDDLFHEAVLRALERLGDLRDESRFRSWFYALMLNAHRARHRRSFWRRLLPLDAMTVEPSRPPESELLDRATRLTRALATLTPEAREAIVLFELEGFSIDEIAALEGVSLSAIKSRLVRARDRLAAHYTKEESAEQGFRPRSPTETRP